MAEDPGKHWVRKVHYASKIVYYAVSCKIILFKEIGKGVDRH